MDHLLEVVANRSVSIAVVLKGGTRRVTILLRISILRSCRLTQTTKFGLVTRGGCPCFQGGPSVPQVCGISYLRAHGLRNSNQILHGDRTRIRGNFFTGPTTYASLVMAKNNQQSSTWRTAGYFYAIRDSANPEAEIGMPHTTIA